MMPGILEIKWDQAVAFYPVYGCLALRLVTGCELKQ